VIAIALAVVQAFGFAEALQEAEVVAARGWQVLALHTATLAGGSCLLAIAARWVSRRGLVNGFVLWWVLFAAFDFVRRDPVRSAARLGGARDVTLLVVCVVLALVATWVVLPRQGATAPGPSAADSAYRGARVKPPAPWIPVPASPIFPLKIASTALTLPATLATFGVPGAPAMVEALRDAGTSHAAYAVLVVGLTLLAAALVNRPAEVGAFLQRLGTVSGSTVRAEATAALRRALVPTLVYVLALDAVKLAATHVSRGALSMTVVALLVAVVLDLGSSVRAHVQTRDLVPVLDSSTPYAVAALRSALAAEGIDARVTGLRTLSLLQGFAPYAPAQLLVRAADIERASALVRHWAVGDAKPNQVTAFEPGKSGGAFGTARTGALCALGVFALALSFASRWARSQHAGPPVEMAVVPVDDGEDPLRGVDEDSLPERVTLYTERVPLGADTAQRHYARVNTAPGESPDQAWARVLPWLEGVALPAGDRWSWETVTEPVEDPDDEERPRSWQVVGLRTFVIVPRPVVTTSDVMGADVGIGDPDGLPFVTVALKPAAAERFHAFTRTWVGRRLAIVVEGHVATAPTVRSAISGGRVQITIAAGDPDRQLAEAQRLAASLGGPLE
jgi:hypothetical protein